MFHHLWLDYWWSSVKGNGPEDLTSLVFVGILSAFLIPAVRRFFHRGWDRLHDKLDGLGAHHKETQRLLHHVIRHHPDIPAIEEPSEHDQEIRG